VSVSRERGFTLIELLVVIAIIAILAALLLPALASAKQTGWQAACLSNHKQLNMAVKEFADDHGDRFPYASAWHNEPSARWAWVADSMSGSSSWSTWAQTDRALFWSPLKPYTGMRIFRCPGDKSTVKWTGRWEAVGEDKGSTNVQQQLRPRSYSMNVFVGGWSGWPFMYDTQYKTYHKYADVESSSQIFTFIEMPAASINSGNFRVVPLKSGDKEIFSQDWPGVYHNGGSVVSFIDGHVEFKRWLEEDTKNIPLAAGSPTSMNSRLVSQNNRDLAWLRNRSTTAEPNNHKWYTIMGGIGRYNRDWNVRNVDDTLYESWAWYWNDSW